MPVSECGHPGAARVETRLVLLGMFADLSDLSRLEGIVGRPVPDGPLLQPESKSHPAEGGGQTHRLGHAAGWQEAVVLHASDVHARLVDPNRAW
jgi:hypothetical protein